MARYNSFTPDEVAAELAALTKTYQDYKAMGLKLNMARGKPSAEQIDLSRPLLDVLDQNADLSSCDGTDCANYGGLSGVPEAKQLLSYLLDDEPENIIAGGSSSLTLMFDAISRLWTFGTEGHTPWGQLDAVKWLCPSPGYDRHFAICETFGMELIPVPLTNEGPDMAVVQQLVASDPAVKGIWCVPQYSNPTGIVYSNQVVEQLASMQCAAKDFRIFWDNAYSVHHLYDNHPSKVADIADACIAAGNPNRYLKFASTSKITFPGAGISGLAASPANIQEALRVMGIQMVGPDKLNQLRHGLYLCTEEALTQHMTAHAHLLAPKFQLVEQKLHDALDGCVECTWSSPQGGYFVSFDGPAQTARRIVALAKEAGVQLTGAGATWPYGKDPQDSNIRIAPSMPPIEELDQAMDVFTTCVKIATLEQLA